MDTFFIVIFLAILIGISIGYYKAWTGLNNYCYEHYDYVPLTLAPALITGISLGGIIVGSVVFLNSGLPNWATCLDTFRYSHISNTREFNGLVAAIFGVVGLSGIFVYQTLKTSLLAAVGSFIMLCIAGSAFVIILALIIVTIAQAFEKRIQSSNY